jgi:hypothetical protein
MSKIIKKDNKKGLSEIYKEFKSSLKEFLKESEDIRNKLKKL